MYKKLSEIAKALSYLTQVGLSVIIPIALWIFIAEFIKRKCNLGSYVVIIGIILGVITAYVNLFKLFKSMSKKNPTDKTAGIDNTKK